MSTSPDPRGRLTPDQWGRLTPEQRTQWEQLWRRLTPEQRWQWESLQMQREVFAAHRADEERWHRELARREQHRRTYNRTAGGVLLGCLGLPLLLLVALMILL